MEEDLACPVSRVKLEPPAASSGAPVQCEAPLPNGRSRRRTVAVLATSASSVIFGAWCIGLPVGVPASDVTPQKVLRGHATPPPPPALAACNPAELEKTCTLEADSTDRCWQSCSRETRMQNMLDLTFMGDAMDGWTWEHCALVGAGDNLKDAGRGPEIDAHYPVIRVNRLPHARMFGDFGRTAHVVFANDRYMDEGRVALMRQGVPILCNGRSICSNASMVFRRLEAESNYTECPQDLVKWWGPSHPFLGCSAELVLSLARRLQGLGGSGETLHVKGVHTPSTGFVAFMTFAPLCKKMNVFGFPKDSRNTADGHQEFPKHNLEVEHGIERLMSTRNFSAIKVTDDWQDKEVRLWRWLQNHVGEIAFIGD